MMTRHRSMAGLLLFLGGVVQVQAAGVVPGGVAGHPLGGVPLEFLLFGLTLLGVMLLHRYTFQVALSGLLAITVYKLLFAGFRFGSGWSGLWAHLEHEWVILANLLGLLLGFELLSRHFEKSRVPVLLPRYLPSGWPGAFALLVVVFVLSAFLDNIAGALIGGAMAHQLFKARVHVGYLAAIVAASNAGGSGSVLGDTTTTMMWLDGVSPLDVLHAYAAALSALLVFGVFAARQQHAHSPILRTAHERVHVDWPRLIIVLLILLAALVTNLLVNGEYRAMADAFPFLGVAVWLVLLLSAWIRRPDWEVLPGSFKGALFLLCLVTAASMMPVEHLPVASWQTTLGLGFLSAVFDNIPLTALALKQGGYDWGVLAYAVGFGGSMLWFGSSAGVALSNMYPEARSAALWLRHGWHIVPAYVIGFFVLLGLLGWQPHEPHKTYPGAPLIQGSALPPTPLHAPAAAP